MKNKTEIIAEKIALEIKYSGISVEDGNFQFDFDNDAPGDIIKLASYRLNSSAFKNNVYWFGYQFEASATSRERTAFINKLKGIGGESFPASVLRRFIELPMNALSNKISSYKISNFVYPLSGRSNLVTKMIRIIHEWLSRDIKSSSFELVKQAPVNIKFDWLSFRDDYASNPNYEQMIKHVKENILPAIQELDYFSLAQNVKPKYRPYITNYLGFPDLSKLEKYASLKGQNILVVDDINTSGSTLNEILRILNEVNENCNIYIYTLIGKI